MAELLLENWLILVIALLLGVFVAWWIFVASRRTRVEFDRGEGDAGPARRNQALIDAPPAASPAVAEPPPAPQGLAGAGEAVAAVTASVPSSSATGDDLTRIKGVGPKLAQRLSELGVTGFAQIAAWSEADIDRIDAELGRFQGRIRRDDWREQTRLLSAGDTAGYAARFGNL